MQTQIGDFDVIHAEGFTLCSGVRPAHTALTHVHSGDRIETQYIYAYEGEASIYADGVPPLHYVVGELNDISRFAGLTTVTHFGPEGGRWLAINPSPTTKRFDFVLLKEGQETTVTGTNRQCVVLTLQGNCQCNEHNIPALQYATITEGRTAHVVVQPQSIVVVLTER